MNNMVSLGEVLAYEQPTKYIVEDTTYDNSFETPVLTAGQSFILGYTDEKENIYTNLPCIIFDDFTTAKKYVDFPFKVKSSAMKILTNDEKKSDIKYVFLKMSTINIDTTLHKRYWISTYSHIKIPLPPLPTQRKIAAVLDKVSDLIAERKKQIEQLDLLVKARFTEMFGDLNQSEFQYSTLLDIISDSKNSLKRGPFGGSLKKDDFVENGFLVYEQRHAIHNDFKYEKYYITNEKHEEMKGFSVKPGDLIVSCSGTLGRIAEIPSYAKPGIINQALLKIKLNNEVVNNIFFITLFKDKYMQGKLFGVSRGSGISNFPSMPEIKSIKFPLPPLPLQTQFAEFVQGVERAREEARQGLKQLEVLYSALIQEYFGEEKQ
ncbi:MAG: restriction endonuclease subunit S [Oscillospiraceae bacterium]|nr:restriction endonuclease subunit S [Oscillospiraceae bacterium]